MKPKTDTSLRKVKFRLSLFLTTGVKYENLSNMSKESFRKA